MKYKLYYIIFSLVIILPGLFFLFTSGLKLGIDFTGGALLEYKFAENVDVNRLKEFIVKKGTEVGQINQTSENTFIIKTKPIESHQLENLRKDLQSEFGGLEIRREESIGPTIGKETSQKALLALALASVSIVLYIAFSFRKVPKPASSWRFGISAVFALIHDVLIVVGIFAIFGKFLNVEIDILFITALLTIIGFSVHDTIVVFDRIRENLTKHIDKKFTTVANISIIQTLGRSLNTSLTVIFVLVAMLLLGGETLKWFVSALLIGIISGTYSSIFNATALLVWWEEKLGH